MHLDNENRPNIAQVDPGQRVFCLHHIHRQCIRKIIVVSGRIDSINTFCLSKVLSLSSIPVDFRLAHLTPPFRGRTILTWASSMSESCDSLALFQEESCSVDPSDQRCIIFYNAFIVCRPLQALVLAIYVSGTSLL